MYRELPKKIFLALIGILLFSSCSGKSKKDEFDLSGFIKPMQQALEINEKTNGSNVAIKEVELKLIPLKDRKEISNSIKYGKKDPFSPSDNQSIKFIEQIKLKGFITFKNKDYALVEYKKQKGFINLKSVGGINTNILPKKAFVTKISPSQEKIYLSIEGEIYTIKLNL